MTRDEMIEKLEGVLYALMAPVEKRGLMSARSLTNDVLAALRAPAVTGEAHQTGPQPTACGGAAAMPISGPERPGESVKYPLNERGTPEDVTAGETAPYTAPPAAGAPPAPGWPDGNNAVRWKPASGCINCGEANDGGFYTSEGQVGGFCSQCWEFLRAEFSEVSVGAPPALVALVQRWQKARLALRDAEDREAYSMAEQLLDIHERALLAWSPAPAPVAPPAEDEPQCAGPFVSAFDCPKCDPRRHQPAPPVVTHHTAYVGNTPVERAPAPPAVAGGDAPPEEGPRCTCPVRPCGACDYDPPRQLRSVNDGPYLKGQAPRRRRQEGQ